MSDSPATHPARQNVRPRLTYLLLAVMVLCFTAQQIVVVHLEKPYDAYLALSGYGMKSGHLWELVTCHAFHTGWIHFILNAAVLLVAGRAVEPVLGGARFARVFIGSALAGAVLQGLVALAGFWLPESMETTAAFLRDRFGGPLACASTGVFGLLSIYCRTKGPWPWRILLGLLVAAVVLPSDPNLAHLAHLAAFATAPLLARRKS